MGGGGSCVGNVIKKDDVFTRSNRAFTGIQNWCHLYDHELGPEVVMGRFRGGSGADTVRVAKVVPQSSGAPCQRTKLPYLLPARSGGAVKPLLAWAA